MAKIRLFSWFKNVFEINGVNMRYIGYQHPNIKSISVLNNPKIYNNISIEAPEMMQKAFNSGQLKVSEQGLFARGKNNLFKDKIIANGGGSKHDLSDEEMQWILEGTKGIGIKSS